MFEEYQVVFVHPCPEEGSENMRFIVRVEVHPRPALKDITSRLFVPMYHSTIKTFPLLCVVPPQVFLPFSVSLLVSCAASGIAKCARCYFSILALHKIFIYLI